MTVDEYWQAIKRVPLYVERDTHDGLGKICRDMDNNPVRVTKPDPYNDAERRAMIEALRSLYGRTAN